MNGQYFLIGTDGRHYGPLSHDDVRTWLADGRASRHSRARRDTEDQWIALREMLEFEDATRPPYLGGDSPADAPADSVRVRDAPHVRDRSRRLDPLSCFRRGWWLLASDFATLAGWTLVATVLMWGIALIPRVGLIIGAFVNNLVMCSIYVLFLSRLRGQRPSLRDVAETVRASALRILLAGVVQSLLTIPILLLGLTRAPLAMGSLLVLVLPCLYLFVGYVFLLPLIVDRRLGVWSAMELSRRAVHPSWFQTFGLLLAAGMLLFASARLFAFLLAVTLPLCWATMMVAYEDLLGTE
jgi:hypothetical protein